MFLVLTLQTTSKSVALATTLVHPRVPNAHSMQFSALWSSAESKEMLLTSVEREVCAGRRVPVLAERLPARHRHGDVHGLAESDIYRHAFRASH